MNRPSKRSQPNVLSQASLRNFAPAHRRLLLTAIPAIAGLLLISACGGSGSASASSASSAPSAGGSNAAGGQGNGRFPGTSGEIAAESGTTLQVQNTSSQTAVNYSSSTRITNTVPATAADVKVGMCVVARPATSSTNASASSTTVAAATVVVSDPVNGSCTSGIGDGAGGFPAAGASGFAGRFRNGSRPSGAPSPGAGGFNRAAFGANGLVTHVDGASFVVASRRREIGAAASPSASASASASQTITNVTVTTTSATTYSKTLSATSTALAVGECVTAIGKTDDTGAVTASSIAIEAKVNGGCASGFGRGPGGFGANAAGGSSG
jgi:hypothetical protein